MKVIDLNTIESCIIISDVHLRDPHDDLTQKFILILNQIHDVKNIILLGDIFEFIAAPSKFFLNLWKNVFDVFESLRARGINIYFIEGNHDFGFEHFKHPRFLQCFTYCGDAHLTFTHPKFGNIFCTHGDVVVCDKKYIWFRALVKSYLLQFFTFHLMSGFLMHKIFMRYARISRNYEKYRLLEMGKVDNFVSRFILKNNINANVFIMGHIHTHINKNINVNDKMLALHTGNWWPKEINLLRISSTEIVRDVKFNFS